MKLKDEGVEKKLKKQTKLPKNLILSEGNKYLRLLLLDKAIASFENILKRDPNDVQAILGRAKCYMRLAKYKEAWNDFEKILNLNPKCTEAVYLKGVTEYLRGNFEKGFQTYWHGYKLEPFCEKLRQGYHLCEKAIENSLDANTRMLLTEKDVKNMKILLENYNLSVEVDAVNREEYDVKGQFSTDLKNLESILKDENLKCIHSLSKDLFDYLRERQKFWKMQETFMRIDNSSNMLFIKNNMCNLLIMNSLVRNFGLCKIALKEGKIGICIKKGNEVLDILGKVPSDFPEKNEIEADTLHYLIMAHLVEEKFTIALKYCSQQLSIVNDNNMFQIKCRAYRDYGEIYHKISNYEKALQLFRESLQFAQFDEERTLILYKISDCNIRLKKLEEAQNSAQKCLEFVVRCHNKSFQFDALLLSAEIAVKIKNMKVAEDYYKQALEVAVQNNDVRQNVVKHILEILEEMSAKDSHSNERIQIVKITQNIKNIKLLKECEKTKQTNKGLDWA